MTPELQRNARLTVDTGVDVVPYPPERCHGEIRLLRAILEDARGLLTGKTRTTKQNVDDAVKWILSRREDAFSFIGCCEYLGFDADAVRHELVLLYAEASERGRFAVGNGQLLGVAEVAEIWGTERAAVHGRIRSGSLPARMWRGTYRIRRSDAEALRKTI